MIVSVKSDTVRKGNPTAGREVDPTGFRKGRLEAIKRGRVWYTTRRAVADYQATVDG
ncbi:MAG: hypothetical protein ISS49_00655 [Anaerolineae bacterium]|nr:hypothetical protein [Anaerolineae bacterium]